MRKVFITETAGFFGFHLAQLLLAEGFRVHGFDGMTEYYDVTRYRQVVGISLRSLAKAGSCHHFRSVSCPEAESIGAGVAV